MKRPHQNIERRPLECLGDVFQEPAGLRIGLDEGVGERRLTEVTARHGDSSPRNAAKKTRVRAFCKGLLKAYDSVPEARASIGGYLAFENSGRPHSSLDGLSLGDTRATNWASKSDPGLGRQSAHAWRSPPRNPGIDRDIARPAARPSRELARRKGAPSRMTAGKTARRHDEVRNDLRTGLRSVPAGGPLRPVEWAPWAGQGSGGGFDRGPGVAVLELLRAEIAQGGVETASVVEPGKVLGDIGEGFILIFDSWK